MKRICPTLILVAFLAMLTALPAGRARARSLVIIGAGATFPYPVYSKWAWLYNRKTGVRINYQSIGSGGGIKQIKAGTVDFGASDAPLKPADLDRFGLMQFPMIMGGVVPVVNLAGVKKGQLKLSAAALAGIYLGRIRRWDDPAIKKDNPDLALPSGEITVVHRADGSGTTWIFTNYLTRISPEWKKRVGSAKAVQWPVGVGGKGNEGVAAFVGRIQGAIGYVEYAYALQNRMNSTLLENRDGRFVSPTAAAFKAAAVGADWAHARGYYMVLTNQPGPDSWPITGASFILMRLVQRDGDKARQVLRFFDWCYQNGEAAAVSLDYVPMPGKVAAMVRESWKQQLRDRDGRPVWR